LSFDSSEIETSTLPILQAEVLDHREIAPEHYVLTVDAPDIAAGVRPGQFVMVRSLGTADPLLPRAYSVYSADPEGGCVSIMYRVVGRGTSRLMLHEPGQTVHVWGPLGNAFTRPAGERAVLVAGGVGIPPLVFWAEHLSRQAAPVEVIALVGAATSDYLVGLDHLRRAKAHVRTATDDGSHGHPGYVTELLPQALENAGATIYACGPMPMLKAVAAIAEARGVPAQLALEAPMACGVGACLGCTVPKRDGGYLRVCTDGPVFSPEQIAW
jgi:dihydroorotate dehydrogenase electron transfer subunit